MRLLRATLAVLTLALLAGAYAGWSGTAQAQTGPAENISFFITSAGPGDGANLGGLRGADRHCAALAAQAGAGLGKEWVAYLSTARDGQIPGVDARNRIGPGPWHNHKGVMIAKSVDDLHSDANNLTKETQLTEKGEMVNGRGDTPNMHDILTGSGPDGRAVTGDMDTTCGNWSSNSADGGAMVGHHDRMGGGDNPTSWNSAHRSNGCSQANLQATGGNGLFYCFVRN
jgi:hypothetical protein